MKPWPWWRRSQEERDLADEIRGHLEERAEQLANEGLSRREAMERARREFGNEVLIAENGRAVWRTQWIEDLRADLVYALRQLRRAPSYTAAAVLTLALGIGANSAIFSVVNGVLLRPLPFHDPDRLIELSSQNIRGTPHPSVMSYPDFLDMRAQNRVFTSIASYRGYDGTLMDGEKAVHLHGHVVAAEFFDILGVKPIAGRGFLRAEEERGQRSIMISQRLWQQRFQSDPAMVGRSILMDRQPYTVVGIVPAGFRFPISREPDDFWMTLAVDRNADSQSPVTEQRGAHMLNVVGRLKPGTSLLQAKANLDAIAANLVHTYPESNKNYPAVYVRTQLERIAGNTRQPLMVLLAAVGLVLLIACANIANLLLARSADRMREFAVRMAIGAGRGRVIRQMLTENLVLAAMGCSAGLLLAYVAVQQATPLLDGGVPRLENIGIDAVVLGYSIALAIATTLLFSLPAILAVRDCHAVGTGGQGSRSVTESNEGVRGTLVVVQIAVGLVLLSGACLLASEFAGILHRDLGFRMDQLAKFDVSVPEQSWGESGQIRFAEQLLERVRSTPGVISAAMGSPLPLSGDDMSISLDILDHPRPPAERVSANVCIVTPGYFATLGTPLLAGRDFTPSDDADHPGVVIVNQAFADKFFPGENPVGKRIEPGASSERTKTKVREIVGVVGNTRQDPLSREPEPIYYFAYPQLPWGVPSTIVRTAADSGVRESTLRQLVAGVDKGVPLYDYRPFDSLFGSAVARPRLNAVLVSSFAAIALALTVVGLYGVLAYSVSRRTREIGVRMALGADRGSILRMVMGRALMLVAIGGTLGIVGSLAGGRVIEKILYGVGSPSPWLLPAACLVVVCAALAAAYLPARRAASTHPMTALRME